VTTAISEAADLTLDIGCGKERVGYVTKGFVATVLTLMLAGLKTAVAKKTLTEQAEQSHLEQFRAAVAAIPQTIAKTEAFFERHKEDLASAPRFSAVGYGPTVGTAKEFETKFSETVRMPSQGIDLEAFMHGPYLEVNPEHRIFFVETESPVKERLKLLIAYESRITNYTYTVALGKAENDRTIGLEVKLDEFIGPVPYDYPVPDLGPSYCGSERNRFDPADLYRLRGGHEEQDAAGRLRLGAESPAFAE